MQQILRLLVVWVFMLALATANEQTVRTTSTTPGPESAKIGPDGTEHAECWYTSTLGRDYKGKVNRTTDGIECQRWDANHAPHSHPFVHSAFRFPESTVSEAENYCRNPDGDPNGPWCYTTDPQTRWSYCNAPKCMESGPCAPYWHRSPANTCWRYFDDERLGYYGARDACRAMGAELVTVARRVDVIFLRSFRSTIGKDNTQMWFGGRHSGGRWRWDGLNTGPIEAFDWSPGEPNSSSERCLEGGIDNKWNDKSCTVPRPYICERP